MKLSGRLTTAKGEPLVGWRLYAADEVTGTYGLSLVTTGDGGTYVLASSRTLPPGAQPQLTVYVLDGDRTVKVLEPPLKWSADGEAQLDIALSLPPPPVYYLHGRVWDPGNNAPVAGATVRTVDSGGVYGEQTVTTGPRGLFELWLPERDGRAPALALSVALGTGAALPVAPPAIAWDAYGTCGLVVPLTWDLAGRVAAGDGTAATGVRVEAWTGDRFAAGETADATGRFTLHLPREAGKPTPPQPTLRVYRGAQLLETVPGREAAGTMVKRNGPAQGTFLVRADVKCVRVDGNRATVSGTIVESTAPEGAAGAVGKAAWFSVEDGDPDRFGNQFGGGPPRCDVDWYSLMEAIGSGSIAVGVSGVQGKGVSKPNDEPFELDATPGLVQWSRFGFGQVDVPLEAERESTTVYTVTGIAIDRRTRAGLAGLRVEAWDAAETFILAVEATDAQGRFTVRLAGTADGAAPAPHFRFYRDGQLLAKPDLPLRWVGAGAEVFAEIDAPVAPASSFRVAGRVIDRQSRGGLTGLRIEAWDSAPRDGGTPGVAGATTADGAFELVLPAAAPAAAVPSRLVQARPLVPVVRPVAGNGLPTLAAPVAATPSAPSLFFRIYAQDRLLETVTPEVSWSTEGIGTTLIEIAPPPAGSQEVGLHELGESIATTVDRVQAELSRYPKTMGAYVLDEIALDMPVEMRVDELGQVRTKVVDATTPEKNVGQVRMTVRPVLGAAHPLSDIPDQPLSVLAELTSQAVATLEAHRIYSVEDLARAASTGAGRAALTTLGLGVDLDRLLDKAALLAFSPLPRRVREALIGLGVAGLRAFVERDADELAAALTTALGQPLTGADVTAWQAAVREALAVPRPSIET